MKDLDLQIVDGGVDTIPEGIDKISEETIRDISEAMEAVGLFLEPEEVEMMIKEGGDSVLKALRGLEKSNEALAKSERRLDTLGPIKGFGVLH